MLVPWIAPCALWMFQPVGTSAVAPPSGARYGVSGMLFAALCAGARSA